MIRQETITVAAAGSDGSATGTERSTSIAGMVLAVHIGYSASAANTTDVVVAGVAPAQALLTESNNATDVWHYPRVAATAVADGSAISGEYALIPVVGYVSVSVAQANDGDEITVALIYDDGR